MKSAKRKRKNRGFTLTELAIVIGVMSILVTVIVPSVVQQAQNNFGEIVVKDMMAIGDAAEWWYHRSHIGNGAPGVTDVPWAGTWPGQAPLDPTAWPIPCVAAPGLAEQYITGALAIPTGETINALQPEAFVSPYNPGGIPLRYTLSLAPQRNCAMVIHTYVPDNVVNMVENLLPNGTCNPPLPGPLNGDCPPPGAIPGVGARPAGYTGCCSYVVRPGLEASLAGYDPVNNANLCDTMYTVDGQFNQVDEDCVFNTSAVSSNCAWRPAGVNPGQGCLTGERAIGAECTGKYCSAPRIYCCQISN